MCIRDSRWLVCILCFWFVVVPFICSGLLFSIPVSYTHLAVNVKANWFIATSAAKYMKDKGGKIVLVSSGRGDRAMENIAPYCTTKSAVMGMVLSLIHI